MVLLMGWVRIDDAFYDHQKFIEAGPAGIALWVTALAWSNRNLTDGFIPTKQIPRLVDFNGMAWEIGGVQGLYAVDEDVTGHAVAVALCELGIFDDVPGGYQIHDYLDFQPSAEQITKKRERERERWKRRNSDEDSESSPDPLRGNSAATPPASQPQPQHLSNDKLETPKKPRQTAPKDDFLPTDAHCDYAKAHGLSLGDERDHWIDWCGANGKTYANLNMGFSTWLRNSVKFGNGGPPIASIEGLAEPRMVLPPARVDTCPSCESSLLACRCEERQTA